MAYQPKFGAPRNQNQGRSVPQRGSAPEERRAASAGLERNYPARGSSAPVSTQDRSPRSASNRRSASPPPQEKKKPSKGVVALFVVLGIFLIPLSLKFSADLLIFVYTSVGRPGVAARTTTANMNLGDSLASQTGQWEQELRAMLGGTAVIPGETVPQETIPQETVPRVRKEYPIAEDVLVAPKPDQSKFGESADPSVLQAVLDEAAWLLDGQSTYFDPDVELLADTTVKYYLDDSIFAITWDQVFDDCVYTFSEVKISHASQFRLHLADGKYGSESLYTTTQMSETVNAVVAAGAFFYRNRGTFGALVYQGEAKKTDGKYSQTCFIDRNGDMKFVRAGILKDSRDTQKYVDENDIWFSVCFGPILVEDYQLEKSKEVTEGYGVGEVKGHYNRAALCQMDKLHYMVVTACQQGDGKLYNKPPTVAEFAQRIYETGCRHAYSLDGGQTATIAMNNELMNRPAYGQQRPISDIIFFATGVTEGG